jgi:predicted small lipoprotein YifL
MRIALPLTVTLFCLGLAGCGQKGPLFLPTEPPPAQSTPAASAPAPAATPSQSTQPQ